jgi:hypothetical protein
LTAAKAREKSIDSQGRQKGKERDMASHEGEEREKKRKKENQRRR